MLDRFRCMLCQSGSRVMLVKCATLSAAKDFRSFDRFGNLCSQLPPGNEGLAEPVVWLSLNLTNQMSSESSIFELFLSQRETANLLVFLLWSA